MLIASVIAFWIGHPLIRLSFRNEQTNAAFRYALVRLRDAAEAVAFYRGEQAEREQLDNRFAAVIANYRRYVRRTVGLLGWNFSVTQAIVPLPFLLQAPRLFAGTIKLGDVMQSATAFGKIQSGLSFFRNAYSQFASYNAATIRLHGLVEANERARRLPVLTTEPSRDGSVELEGVEVRTPAGDQLIEPLDLRLERGESMVITGSSGTGKTTLLRSLAALWPAATGLWCRPAGDHETMFVSQLPYVPLGDLRAVVAYPARSADIDDDRLRDVLSRVFLPHLRDRLDEKRDWAKVLSPGEQQRIAFARVLLARPKAVFLDEATSALDEGLEFALYQLLRTELPDTIVVSVGHARRRTAPRAPVGAARRRCLAAQCRRRRRMRSRFASRPNQCDHASVDDDADIAQARLLVAALWEQVNETSDKLEAAERRVARAHAANISSHHRRQAAELRRELYHAHRLIDGLHRRFPALGLNGTRA